MPETIVQHLWQSTLMLVAAWLLARACGRNAAGLRYWIWFGASMKFLLPFALLQAVGERIGRVLPSPPMGSALIETSSAIFVTPVANLAVVPESLLPRVETALLAIWMLGAAFLLLRWFLQWRAIHEIVKDASPLSIDLPVSVGVTDEEVAPGVFGVFHPVVIVPRRVLDELSAAELQAILAHESCHIRRRDNLTAALHRVVEVIFWFYPLTWWIGAQLLREREAACDEAVIDEGHEQSVYAESILHVCRLGVVAESGMVAASTGGDLMQRMCGIMKAERIAPIDYGRFMLLVGTAMLACYGPLAAGVVAGATREASVSGPIVLREVTLMPASATWWPNTQFDAEARQLKLQNVSLRKLISLAYPASHVNGDPELIDRVRYDIDARWEASVDTSERGVYRALLNRVLSTNSNLELYIRVF